MKGVGEAEFLHASMEKVKGELWLVITKKDDRKQKSIENRRMRKKKMKDGIRDMNP